MVEPLLLIGFIHRQDSASDETPTVVIVPGLTSDSSSKYVKHLVRGLSDKGWRVLVINHRGLGGVSITSDHFYNAGWTEDLRRLLPYVQQKYPKAPLLAIGASIGANILIKYLGEEGIKTPIGGAVAICCPWDLVVCDRFIRRKWVQALYNKALTSGLCQYAHLHQTALSRMMDWNLLSSSRTVRDFDNHCTRHVGKYETVDTYYRRCGSAQFLESVAVPLLCVSAEDDPICTKEAIPYDECRVNSNVILALTKHGGHLGYFEGLSAKSIWYVGVVTEFSKFLLSSSLLHRQNEGLQQASTRMGSDVDKGPFLDIGDDFTVAAGVEDAGAEDSSTVFERSAETCELRPEASFKEIDPLFGPQLIRDKSGTLASGQMAEDGNYVIVADDFGGPLYKRVDEKFEKGDALSNESKGHKQIAGQTTLRLQFSELMALQSVLSKLLQQLRQESSIPGESRQDGTSGVVDCETRALASPIPKSSFGSRDNQKENKEKLPAKISAQNSSKKTSIREIERGISERANSEKKDLASHLVSQNRRTFWLLTYIALVTTVPFCGSALMLRTRGKILQVMSRHWGKYNP